MEVIPLQNKGYWNKYVESIPAADIYYRSEYIASLIDGNDQGVLLCCEKDATRMCYPVVIRDVANVPFFQGRIPTGRYFDMEVPYGYGGPIGVNVDDGFLRTFRGELLEWCREHCVVSQFVRFHPVLENAAYAEVFLDQYAYVHHTIAVDTSDEASLFSNMDAKKRNMIRKAMRNGVSVVFDENLEGIEEFKSIYKSTMDRHNAADMYYFTDKYYDYLRSDFIDHTLLLRAVHEGRTISAALFFCDGKAMHYHLSGTVYEYRGMASTDLILYEASRWAAQRGIRSLHLGGGLSEDDSLFSFKKGFCKEGVRDFYIGRSVFRQRDFDDLVQCRRSFDGSFDSRSGRMIPYR